MKHRTVREHPDFTASLSDLGDLRRLDEVLSGIYWAISTRPEARPVVPGTKRLRVIKSDGFGDTPAVRVFYAIAEDDDELVELLLIEPYDGVGGA